jgi:uncharacterized protein (DUF1697 family)
MSATHVALLRGINVGKAKRVAMADLRKLVEGLGHRDVRTLLNSGNVVFTAPAAASDPGPAIERAIEKKLGVSSRVIVLTARELRDVMRGNPLLEVARDHTRLMTAVLATPADRKRLEPLLKTKWTPEALALGKRVAYVWCPTSILESPLFKAATRALGDAVTSRNWATMLKLQALVETP